MRSRKEKQKSGRKTNLLIALNTMFVIFGLVSGFSGTIAWFNSQRAFDVTAGSFSISAPPGVEYNLYYLAEFTVDSPSATFDGNWNTVIEEFSGYELDYEDATFASVDDYVDDRDPEPETPANPTIINHLWPAHKLTFAIEITQGEMSQLSINEWGERTSSDAMLAADSYVRLSWAIDIYGKAYSAASVDLAWASYYQDLHSETPADVPSDAFNFNQNNLTADEEGEYTSDTPISVITSIDTPLENQKTIAFFTIEFSNLDSTFYTQSLSAPYYYSKSVLGNSNCYENLELTSLSFKIA